VPTLIEWDSNIPEWSTLRDEAEVARAILRDHAAFTAESDHASR